MRDRRHARLPGRSACSTSRRRSRACRPRGGRGSELSASCADAEATAGILCAECVDIVRPRVTSRAAEGRDRAGKGVRFAMSSFCTCRIPHPSLPSVTENSCRWPLCSSFSRSRARPSGRKTKKPLRPKRGGGQGRGAARGEQASRRRCRVKEFDLCGARRPRRSRKRPLPARRAPRRADRRLRRLPRAPRRGLQALVALHEMCPRRRSAGEERAPRVRRARARAGRARARAEHAGGRRGARARAELETRAAAARTRPRARSAAAASSSRADEIEETGVPAGRPAIGRAPRACVVIGAATPAPAERARQPPAESSAGSARAWRAVRGPART